MRGLREWGLAFEVSMLEKDLESGLKNLRIKRSRSKNSKAM